MAIHNRRCYDCGNVAEHSDNVVPEVLCKKCGSQDTRIVRAKLPPRNISDSDDPCAELRDEIERLRALSNSLQIDLDLANCERRDALDALAAFQGYDGDEELWAAMKRERDEAVAKLAEARQLLDLSLCDVIPRSGLACDIEAFLDETQPNGGK